MIESRGRAIAAAFLGLAMTAPTVGSEPPTDAPAGRIFYVRQTVGDDRNDGSSPDRAWRRISELDSALEAGDTAVVGPGLYREELILRNDGAPDRPIRILADPTGAHTGDPPGPVIITGAEPVDESIFEPSEFPGVYSAPFSTFQVSGVAEMDGPQYRYFRARSTREHLQEGLTLLETVSRLASTYHYDIDEQIIYVHTSDGRSPAEHELEFMRRGAGISLSGRSHVVIQGFTFRHTGDAGISFGNGTRDVAAIGNVSWGSRQGIRVNGSTNVLLAGNTLFRNENSGVYFVRGSVGGSVIGNVFYENVKGFRWGSQSNAGLAIGNTSFGNLEAGVSMEDVSGARLLSNSFADNGRAQILAMVSSFISDGNCFEVQTPEQMLAELSHQDRFAGLEGFQEAFGHDLGSREGGCGELPAPLDVRMLHSQAMDYREEALKTLAAKSDG